MLCFTDDVSLDLLTAATVSCVDTRGLNLFLVRRLTVFIGVSSSLRFWADGGGVVGTFVVALITGSGLTSVGDGVVGTPAATLIAGSGLASVGDGVVGTSAATLITGSELGSVVVVSLLVVVVSLLAFEVLVSASGTVDADVTSGSTSAASNSSTEENTRIDEADVVDSISMTDSRTLEAFIAAACSSTSLTLHGSGVSDRMLNTGQFTRPGQSITCWLLSYICGVCAKRQ